MIVLITGPVRAGKSTRAVTVARNFGLPVTHLLTARLDPHDREMTERVERHRIERAGDRAIELWRAGTCDLPALVEAAPAGTTLLVDSLGTWVAGHLLDLEALVESDLPAALRRLEAQTDPLVGSLAATRSHVVVVAEETGWGLVPVSAQGRLFRDHLGRLTRRIACGAQRVELVVAGFALDLRTHGVLVGDDASR